MEMLSGFIGNVSSFIWGPFGLFLLVGTGLFLTVGLKGITLTKIPLAFKLLLQGKNKNEQNGEGDLTPFQALMTSLAATVGTGNIAGVATAIALGGPGAVFWMWVSALVGMASKMGEAVLAIKYREYDKESGTYSGGPMYYIKNGMGKKWAWLGTVFAVFGSIAGFGIGCSVQANSVAQSVATYGIPPYITGLVLAVLVFIVIIGGIKRIGNVAEKLVPIMAITYIIGTLLIIFLNIGSLIPALKLIISSAFTEHAATGGFAGTVMMNSMRFGIARGVFSNEAGLGTAAIAHAASTVKKPGQQAIIAMLGGFIDTIIICSMTALVIIMTGEWSSGLNGSVLTVSAFNKGIPGIGGHLVIFGLIFFAFSTILSWSYYGEKTFTFIFGLKSAQIYKFLWVFGVFLGSIANLELVWLLADALNGLMMLPNLIALLALSPVIFKEMKVYLMELKLMTI